MTVWVIITYLITAGIAVYALAQREQIERERRNREDMALKRDVLRRFVGYSYRLTETMMTRGLSDPGEPFIALNEACIVYHECPAVTEALKQFKDNAGQRHPI